MWPQLVQSLHGAACRTMSTDSVAARLQGSEVCSRQLQCNCLCIRLLPHRWAPRRNRTSAGQCCVVYPVAAFAGHVIPTCYVLDLCCCFCHLLQLPAIWDIMHLVFASALTLHWSPYNMCIQRQLLQCVLVQMTTAGAPAWTCNIQIIAAIAQHEQSPG